MPRPTQQHIVDRKVIDAIANPQLLQTVAAPVDQGTTDNSWAGVSEALTAFSPKLQELVSLHVEEDRRKGKVARQAGVSPEEGASASWLEGYNLLDGYIKAKDDTAKLQTDWAAAPKDGSVTFDQFAGDWYAGKKKEIQNPHVLRGYEGVVFEEIDKLRDTRRKELTAEVTATQEANSQKWITDQIREHTAQGRLMPTQQLDSIRQTLKAKFGTEGKAFNELLFNSLSELGNDGHYEVWDVTKENHPDGTPGMYHIPDMQKKIMAAQNHAKLVFVQKTEQLEKAAKKDRENRQEAALGDVFREAATGDPAKADHAFRALVATQPNLFKASEIAEWNTRFVSVSKERETPDNLNNNANLKALIWQGKAKSGNIIQAMQQKLITAKQADGLLTDVGQYDGQMRQLASSNKQMDAYARANAEQILVGYLPMTASEFDFEKSGTIAAQKASVNQARIELITKLTDPQFKGSALDAANDIGVKYRKAWDAAGWQTGRTETFNPNLPAPKVPLPKDKSDTSALKFINDKVMSNEWTVEEGRKQKALLKNHQQK